MVFRESVAVLVSKVERLPSTVVVMSVFLPVLFGVFVSFVVVIVLELVDV